MKLTIYDLRFTGCSVRAESDAFTAALSPAQQQRDET